MTVGTFPSGVAALQDGSRFYVSNSGSNNVSVVSATSFAVLKTVAVGVNPTFVAAEPGSTKVYVTNGAAPPPASSRPSNDVVSTAICGATARPRLYGVAAHCSSR